MTVGRAGSGERPDGAQRSVGAELRTILDVLGRLALAGTLAGLVGGATMGALSRIAMRISGLMSVSDRILVTENGNLVGRITLEGTIFLTFLGAVIGVVIGLTYVVLRHWLPPGPRVRAVAFGVLVLAGLGSLVVSAGNDDFTKLGEPITNVALFAALLFGGGVVIAAVADRVHARLRPRPVDPWFYAAAYLLIVLGSVIFGMLAVVLAAIPLVWLGLQSLGRRGVPLPSLVRGSALWWAGEALLVGGAAVGLVLFGIEVSEILATPG